MKNHYSNLLNTVSILSLFMLLMPLNAFSQEYKGQPFHNMEELEDQNQGLYNQIYAIIKHYPEFSYQYEFVNGKVSNVDVQGVSDPIDQKRLELLIFDWKKNAEKILNVPSRTGVYYSVEDPAEPTMGYVDFHHQILQHITYPSDAKSAGVGGMVFLKFIVDRDGNIRYLTASEDIKSPYVNLVNELKEEALSAFKATNAKWKPATVDGVAVASYVVEPIDFNFEENPDIPGLIE